jgi:RNA polymerase sigma-70 factor (ECF subfamily)
MTDGSWGSAGRRPRTPVEAAFLDCERSLKRFITRLRRSDRDVEDLAHDALVSALQAENGSAIEKPQAYLFRAARNLVVRSHAKRSREIIGYLDDAIEQTAASRESSAEDRLVSRERLALLWEAIATLPPSCRRVFVMRKLYGYSHKEISEKLGISTSTVEKHLATGLARCLAFVRAQGDEELSDTAARTASRKPRNRATRRK